MLECERRLLGAASILVACNCALNLYEFARVARFG